MGFPINYSKKFVLGKNKIRENDIKILRRNILIALQKENASFANIEGETIKFRGGMRFVNSWNILVPISYGEIELKEKQDTIIVTLNLQFTQLLITVSIMVILLISIIVFQSSEVSPKELLITLFIGWGWLFGANYIATAYRFPRFIKRQINI